MTTYTSLHKLLVDNDPGGVIELLKDAEVTPPENTRIILSFGGGAGKEPFENFVSFPNIFKTTEFENRTDNILIIAIDPTFFGSMGDKVSAAFRKKIRTYRYEHFEKKKPKHTNNLVESEADSAIGIYTVNSEIPTCKDKTVSNLALFELQQPGSSFEYYRDVALCDLKVPVIDESVYIQRNNKSTTEYIKDWIRSFTELIQIINSRGFKLFIHNDAWFDFKGSVFNSNKMVTFPKYGINFELLMIIPKLLIENIDNERLFMLREEMLEPGIKTTKIYNFLDPEAIVRFPDFEEFSNANRLAKARAEMIAAAPAALGGAGGPSAASAALGGAGGTSAAPAAATKNSRRRRRGRRRMHGGRKTQKK